MIIEGQLVGCPMGRDEAVDTLQFTGAFRGADKPQNVVGGQLGVSANGGEQWQSVSRNLPPVNQLLFG